ncbi:MAG TPA: MBL fold metallo-hydrolase [bacterium]|nr:MBL fold metallo-hydrolase [bacterium]HRR91415.1 MBL fold metallo-hydrolase [bacterium]
MMLVTFLGAAGEVTGSCYLLETDRCKYLVDCGTFQGKDEERNNASFSFLPSSIESVILTHAHLDHSGRIPKLVKDGFRGKIYATIPTIELCEILWLDTVKLMREETERINRKNKRAGKSMTEPLYTDEDVQLALSLFEPVPYDSIINLKDIRVRFRDASHVLGSSSIEVWDEETKIVFSGDIGQWEGVMNDSPALIEQADYVVIESTYGDRLHRSLEDTRKEFKDTIQSAILEKGKVLIPSFVVDRAQRVIYELKLLKEAGILPGNFPMYFDSPMGKKVTDIYRKYSNLLSGELQRYYLNSEDPFDIENLHYLVSVDDSKKINDLDRGIVIAGSGMCTGGRILHHLKHNIWKENTHIIFVGYQAYGTLGREIINGVKTANIMGEEIAIKAKIHTINGFSAHADQNDLLSWAEGFQNRPMFIITHGELNSSKILSEVFRLKGYETFIPVRGQSIDLVKREVSSVKVAPFIDLEPLLVELDREFFNLKAKLEDSSIPVEKLGVVQAILLLLKEVNK